MCCDSGDVDLLVVLYPAWATERTTFWRKISRRERKPKESGGSLALMECTPLDTTYIIYTVQIILLKVTLWDKTKLGDSFHCPKLPTVCFNTYESWRNRNSLKTKCGGCSYCLFTYLLKQFSNKSNKLC